MKWRNPENYKSSLKKWESDLWERMMSNYTMMSDKRASWSRIIWDSCGFCWEFRRKHIYSSCSSCPLFKKHCVSSLSRCIWDLKNTMGQLYIYWIKDEEENFRKLQKEFIEVIKSFAPD